MCVVEAFLPVIDIPNVADAVILVRTSSGRPSKQEQKLKGKHSAAYEKKMQIVSVPGQQTTHFVSVLCTALLW